jgi:methionine sulfoxide reductase heme-binding subunit
VTTATAPAGHVRGPGGAPSAMRRRLLRHFLPLAGATTVALAVLLTIPFFDANRYPPPADIFTEGAKGALPGDDYPPAAGPTDSSGGHDPSMGSQHGRPGTTPAPTPSAPSNAAPPAGPSAPTHAGGDEPTGAGTTASSDHAGDPETIVRMRRLSTITGYLAVAFITLTLLIGPVNLLRRRRLPISSYLRRDIGLWAAVTSIAHVVFGFLVKHGDGQILGYFFEPGDRSRILTNSFGLANWVGLIAAAIVIVLAAISSDAALRTLKAKRWKRLQRWNYALAALAAVHAVLYGALWRLTSPYTVTLLASVVAIAVAQGIGVRLWRRRNHPGDIAS